MADENDNKDSPAEPVKDAEIMIEGDGEEEDESEDEEEDDDFQFIVNEDDLDMAAANPEPAKSTAETETANSEAQPNEESGKSTEARPRSQSTSATTNVTNSFSLQDSATPSAINAANYNDFMGQVYPPGVPRKRTAMDVNIDELTDHPWRRPGARLEDFFNYGLNERSWREYAARQITKRLEKQKESQPQTFGVPQNTFQAPPAPTHYNGNQNSNTFQGQ